MLPALPKVGSALSAEQVATIEEQVSAAVMTVTSIDELKEWLAQIAALEGYLRSRDMQGPALGAARRIEGRIGQLFGDPQTGGRGKTSPHGDEFWNHEIFDFRLLAKALTGECPLTPDEWRRSRRALVALVRFRLGLMPITPPFPDDTYHAIVVDPPWELTTGPNVFGSKERGNEALAYSQMTLDDIRELDVQKLAAPDAHLYLWTTNRYLEDAYDIARAWGFEPSTLLVWCKQPRGVGLGGTFRLTAEFIVFACRGSLPARRIVERTWFEWPRGQHSVKPDAFYQLVESVTPAPYIDLFARKARPHWTVWGAEAPTAVQA